MAQVLFDIDTERFDRRDVEDFCALFSTLRVEQSIDHGQKRSQGFAAAGGGEHEHVFARRDEWPSLYLNFGGIGELIVEPVTGRGMK